MPDTLLSPFPPPPARPRRPGRTLVLIAGGLCAAILTVCAGLGVVDGTTGRAHHVERRAFPASVTHLVVRGSSADVHLHARDAATGAATGVGAEREGGGIELAARLGGLAGAPALSTSVDGDTLTVSSRCDGSWHCSVEYDLTVPAAVRTDVRVGSGNVIADGLRGDATLRTSSGDIMVHGPIGRFDAASGSGDVRVFDSRSRSLRAGTSSGDVRVDQLVAPDDVDAHTSSGDVRVLLPAGDETYAVEATTDSGDRRVHVADDPRSARRIFATTSSGDVVVHYRDDS